MSDPVELTSAEIGEIFDEIDRLAWSCHHANDWKPMADRYAGLDPTGMSVVEMITNLRTVFAYRQNIPTWSSFRDRVGEELSHRGLDAQRFLRGLF